MSQGRTRHLTAKLDRNRLRQLHLGWLMDLPGQYSLMVSVAQRFFLLELLSHSLNLFHHGRLESDDLGRELQHLCFKQYETVTQKENFIIIYKIHRARHILILRWNVYSSYVQPRN